MVLCVAAIGKPLASTLIWKQKTIPEEFKAFAAFDIPVIVNESGWETNATFEEIMLNIYIPQLIERRERLQKKKDILLLLDGHGSRISLPIIFSCMRWHITILVIPAHTSSILQPLDLGINGAFKSCFAKEATMRINGRPVSARESGASSFFSSSSFPSEESSKSPVSQNTALSVEEDSHLLTDPSDPTLFRIHPNMHVTASSLPEIYSVRDNVQVPSIPDSVTFQTVGQNQSSSEQRQLLAEVIPRSLEKALSLSVISGAWTKSGIFPFDPSTVLNRVPEGETILTTPSTKPIISGRILTCKEMIIEIMEWEIQKRMRVLKQEVSDNDAEVHIIESILDDVYSKINEAERRYSPGTLLTPEPIRKTTEDIQTIYSEIEQLRMKRCSKITEEDKCNEDTVHTIPDDVLPCSSERTQQLTLSQISRIREMPDNLFREYCLSFGNKATKPTSRPIHQRKRLTIKEKKKKALTFHESEDQTIQDDSYNDSTSTSCNHNSGSVQTELRRTRSLRMQHRFDDCIDSDEMDEL